MESQREGVPRWLEKLRDKIATSDEFAALSNRLYEQVRTAARQDSLPPFYKLDETEQRVLMLRAKQHVDPDVYEAFRDKAWRALDSALDHEAERNLLDSPAHLAAGGKVGAILELAARGAGALLGRARQQSSVGWLVNANLPPVLRTVLWEHTLQNPGARAQYDAKRQESIGAVISPRDGTILEQCQLALQAADLDLLPQLARMKACASYVDTIRPNAPATPDDGSRPTADSVVPHPIFWIIPLLRALPDATDAELVERYEALLRERKPQLELPESKVLNPIHQVEHDVRMCHELLKTADRALALHLEKRLGISVATKLTAKASARLAVGFFSPECTAFAWDTCFLAGWVYLEHMLAAGLIALKAGLLACTSADHVRAHVAEFAPQLTVEQLRAALEPELMADVRQAVGVSGSSSDVPLLPPGGLL